MSFGTESTDLRSISTPSPIIVETLRFRSISPSAATTHLDSLEENLELKQIQKMQSLIEGRLTSHFSHPIDPHHSETWLDLFKDPEHVASRQHSHHRNVCFCFLFTLAIDNTLDMDKKIDMTKKALEELDLSHSFNLCGSFIELPPLMVCCILPHAPAFLKDYVFQNVSDSGLLLSWISVIFEYKECWQESTQKGLLNLLKTTSLPSSQAFRLHTSREFKGWFSLIKQNTALPAIAPFHTSETVDSLGDFIHFTEATSLSQKLSTLYLFIKERKTEKIKETLDTLQNERPLDLMSAFLGLSPASAAHILTYAPPKMQSDVFSVVLDPETLLLWVESAFEYRDSIGKAILNLFGLYAERSFLDYFHESADLEIRQWASRVDPIFFRIPAEASCGCVIS